MEKFITEKERKIPVYGETDVLVVGGGPAGIAAALSAARSGVEVIITEASGKLGGLATGGIVMYLPNLDNGGELRCGGIQREWAERLKATEGAAFGPSDMEIGSHERSALEKWNPTLCNVWNDTVCDSVFFDPEYLTILFCQMIREEKNITPYLHAYAVSAYLENGTLRGVIYESKQGRFAVLAKRIVDCTGDGDIFASAGAEYEFSFDAPLRNSDMSLVTRVEDVDYDEFMRWKWANGESYAEKIGRLQTQVGYRLAMWAGSRNSYCWINNAIRGKNPLTVKDRTEMEFVFRTTYPEVQAFFRKEFPGFENAKLMDFASMLGVRSSRRLKGLYQIQFSDFQNGVVFDDTIAATPAMHSCNMPNVGEVGMYIPYRALVPEKLENLLAAGRCISCDVPSHNWLNLIPHSVATGEAAGAAAAMSIKENVRLRDVNVKKLQQVLVEEKRCCLG